MSRVRLTSGGIVVNKWYGYAGVLGAIALILHFVLSISASASVIADLLYIALIVLLVLAGIDAKHNRKKPVGRGAMMGLIYGFLSAVGSVLYVPNAAVMTHLMHKELPALSSAELAHLVAISATMPARIGALATNMVISVIMGLLFAWLGSLFAKNPGSDNAVI